MGLTSAVTRPQISVWVSEVKKVDDVTNLVIMVFSQFLKASLVFIVKKV